MAPNTKPSAAVYRRRRLAVGLLAILLLAALIAGGTAIARMIDTGTTTASGAQGSIITTSTASPGAGEEATEKPGGVCEDKVVVSAATDKQDYTAQENPVLTLTVSNKSSQDCQVNLGTAEMEFLITSGDDRIFSSRDCQVEASDNYQTMEPGQTEQAKFIWERNRTAPECDAVTVKPRPGTYVLVTRLGDRTSDGAVFRLN